jgi:hypothetical protein
MTQRSTSAALRALGRGAGDASDDEPAAGDNAFHTEETEHRVRKDAERLEALRRTVQAQFLRPTTLIPQAAVLSWH